jgi:division protein CdvB (Snf7/Vps24/ESCRT-III family)
LSLKITKAWDENPSLISKLGDRLSTYKLPLKDKLLQMLYRLKIQKKAFEELIHKLQRYDQKLLNQCLNFQRSNDKQRAILYANECAEVRKMATHILSSHLALERAIIRLDTIKQFDDIPSVLHLIPSILKTVKSNISYLLPFTSNELSEICEELNDLVLQFGEVPSPSNLQITQEAQTILKEAKILAQEEMKEIFPKLPISNLEVEKEKYIQIRKGVELESR